MTCIRLQHIFFSNELKCYLMMTQWNSNSPTTEEIIYVSLATFFRLQHLGTVESSCQWARCSKLVILKSFWVILVLWFRKAPKSALNLGDMVWRYSFGEISSASLCCVVIKSKMISKLNIIYIATLALCSSRISIYSRRRKVDKRPSHRSNILHSIN